MRDLVDGLPPSELPQNQQDYATQLQKALQLQTRSPADLDSRLGLGIQVDDWTAREFWALRRGSSWQQLRVVAAVAGQRGWCQATSVAGTLVVLEKVILSHRFGAPLDFNFGLSVQEAGGAGGGVSSLDDRGAFNRQNTACAVLSGAAAAPSVPPGGYIICPNDSNVVIDVEAVLTGAISTAGVVSCWKIVCAVANAAYTVTLVYRERALLQTERNL